METKEKAAVNESQQANPMMTGMQMMKEMMTQMGRGESPMAMMQKMMGKMGKDEGGMPMPQMMGMCMGMCAEMLTAIKTVAGLAAFATPELQKLFAEWLKGREEQAMALLNSAGGIGVSELAAALKISEESAAHLVARLSAQGKAKLRIEPVTGKTQKE